jgi:SAM-dependent methyltransferase
MTQHGPDWGDGAYEAFSSELAAAAMRLADVAAVAPGDDVVDLGAGDGNVSVWLARTGANLTAVDPSERLLHLAARRCAEAGHPITTLVGAGEALPLPDASADALTSGFGVIFSGAPRDAIREILRVLRPDGRFIYSAWRPEGGIAEVGTLIRAVLTGDAPAPTVPPPAWHEPLSWLPELVPGGADTITVHEGTLDFVAESGAAWMAHQEHFHPIWRAARRALDDETAWRELMARSAEILDAHSTLPEAMLVPSPYVVVEVRPAG